MNGEKGWVLRLVTPGDRGVLPRTGQHLQESEMMVFRRSYHDKNYLLWRQNESRPEKKNNCSYDILEVLLLLER